MVVAVRRSGGAGVLHCCCCGRHSRRVSFELSVEKCSSFLFVVVVVVELWLIILSYGLASSIYKRRRRK